MAENDSIAGIVGVEGVEWRVDVVLASSAMQRVMTPVVLVRVALTDGRVKTIEMSQAQLHLLRHSLAKMLKEIHYFEGKAPPAGLKKKMDRQLVK